MKTIAVIGGGPAGLMAAEVLSQGGIQVDLYDAMPSVGRKFLLAGVGGMNITHSEPLTPFCRATARSAAAVKPLLDAFTPAVLREWIHGLGIETFVGSSGRVFPKEHEGCAAAACVAASSARSRRASFMRAIAGWAGRMTATCALPRPVVNSLSMRTRWCWRSAAAVGRSWDRMVRGCRLLARAWCRCRALAAVELRLRCGRRLERAPAQPLRRAAAENRGAAIHRCGRTTCMSAKAS